MRVITLALKDIKQLFQSWQTAFFLLIMPVVFTLMFGFMFGGMGGSEDDPRRSLICWKGPKLSGRSSTTVIRKPLFAKRLRPVTCKVRWYCRKVLVMRSPPGMLSRWR